MHGRRLGQGHEQNAREGRIAQPLQQSQHFLWLRAARLALQFAVVCLASVQQEEGVTGGGGVENDEAVCSLSHLASKGAEHSNFFCAGRALLEEDLRSPC